MTSVHARVTLALAVLAIVVFAAGAVLGTVAPSSTLGMSFGVAAAATLMAVMLYSARRAMPAVRRLGPTQRYLQLHLWGGTLFLLLFLLHTNFAVPDGLFALLLWALTVWVVVTGAVGLLLQRAVPRVLGPAASFEVHLHRVPELVQQLRGRAESAAAGAEAGVRTWYEQEVAADMAAPRMSTAVLLRDPARPGGGTRHIELLERTLPSESVAALHAIRELHASKHELDVHYTLQRVLRGWLYLHLPVAVVLLVMVALHVFFIIYF